MYGRILYSYLSLVIGNEGDHVFLLSWSVAELFLSMGHVNNIVNPEGPFKHDY